ncbi:hypothetical protein Q7A53_05810 [Halobacillus rhizosphaerae]|uniref:hypothetical protein n=1 Tax=Halobacillus rhizosphaerae TaxID=3064889 RepID=UPI00398B2AAF
MFGIEYEDKCGKRYSSEYIFNSYDEAVNFLVKGGFNMVHYAIFDKVNDGWLDYQRAFVSKKMIYVDSVSKIGF